MNSTTESRNRFQEAMAMFNKFSSSSSGKDDATRKSYNFKKPDVIEWPSVSVHTTFRADSCGISKISQSSSHNIKITVTKMNDSFTSNTDMISESSNHTFADTTISSVADGEDYIIEETPMIDIPTPASEKSCPKPSWAVIRNKMKSIPRPDDYLAGCCPEYSPRRQKGLTKMIDLTK